MISSFYGYKLVESEQCVEFVQRKTHKKKRINKKWLRKYGHKAVPMKDKVIVAGGKIFAHPVMMKRIVAEVEKRNPGKTAYEEIVESYETLKNKDVPENRMHFYVDVTTMSDSKSVEMFKGTGVVVHKRDGSQWVNGKRVEDGDGKE